jgi:hypothetical protein
MRLLNVPTPALLLFLTLGVGSAGGCASILGIKEFSDGPDGGPTVQTSSGGGDDVIETPDASSPTGDDGGTVIVPIADGGPADGGPADVDLGPEISAPPPPPVTGKAGFDLAAAGNVSTSTSYKLIGTLGEAPGGNLVSTSTSFTLKAGLVAVTQ